jgi:hypothetical protein
MKRSLPLILVVTLAALGTAATGTAHTDHSTTNAQAVYAHLNTAQQVPSPDGAPTGARATFSGTYNSRTRIFTWRLQWVRVSEPTREADPVRPRCH